MPVLPSPTPFTLVNARVLLPDGLTSGDVAIVDGRITDSCAGKRVDASGLMVLPGMVDLHGDAFERHLAPRRGALRHLDDGLRAVEQELAANGITTAYLPQFWSWQGGMRGPDFARWLCVGLGKYDASLDIRVQLRLDVACHADFDDVRALIVEHGIDYLVLNDHLPHDALAAGKRPPRLDGQAIRANRSPAEHLSLMRELHDAMPQAWVRVADLLASFSDMRIGSHDDATPQERTEMRRLGAGIAEFPMTEETLQSARKAGDFIILGAPNVVRGRSHDRGVPARAMIEAGLCDALASDYHYPSLHHAAFTLKAGGMPLADAWALVSRSPAMTMGMDDRGIIAQGKRADLVLVEEGSRRLVGTIAAGRLVYVTEPLTMRLLAA